MADPYALIHHFFQDPKTGKFQLDHNGNALKGYYYQFSTRTHADQRVNWTI
jgi:hypothetical protein